MSRHNLTDIYPSVYWHVTKSPLAGVCVWNSTCPPTQGVGCWAGHPPQPRELNATLLPSVGPAQPVPSKPRPHPTCRSCSISSYSLSSSCARSCSRTLASRCLLLHVLYSASLTSLLARHKVLSVSSAKRYRDETSGLPSLNQDDSHGGPGHHASQPRCPHGHSQRHSRF